MEKIANMAITIASYTEEGRLGIIVSFNKSPGSFAPPERWPATRVHSQCNQRVINSV